MAGDQGLCFAVSRAISMFWLINGCFYTSKSSTTLQQYSSPHRLKTTMRQKFPYKLHQMCGVLHLGVLPCVCSARYAHSMPIAWEHRDTSGRRPQSSWPNLPFPGNLVPHKCVPPWVNLRTISCAACQLSAFPIPVVSAAVTSLLPFIYKQAQGNFRLWLDPRSWIQWLWWNRLWSPAPPRCLSKQLCQQTSNTATVLTSHCPWYPLFRGPLIATSSTLPRRTALMLCFLVLWIESRTLFS